jgi:hypothetical protein
MVSELFLEHNCLIRQGCRLRILDCGLRIGGVSFDCGFWISDCGLKDGCRLRILDFGLRIEGMAVGFGWRSCPVEYRQSGSPPENSTGLRF